MGIKLITKFVSVGEAQSRLSVFDILLYPLPKLFSHLCVEISDIDSCSYLLHPFGQITPERLWYFFQCNDCKWHITLPHYNSHHSLQVAPYYPKVPKILLQAFLHHPHPINTASLIQPALQAFFLRKYPLPSFL